MARFLLFTFVLFGLVMLWGALTTDDRLVTIICLVFSAFDFTFAILNAPDALRSTKHG